MCAIGRLLRALRARGEPPRARSQRVRLGFDNTHEGVSQPNGTSDEELSRWLTAAGSEMMPRLGATRRMRASGFWRDPAAGSYFELASSAECARVSAPWFYPITILGAFGWQMFDESRPDASFIDALSSATIDRLRQRSAYLLIDDTFDATLSRARFDPSPRLVNRVVDRCRVLGIDPRRIVLVTSNLRPSNTTASEGVHIVRLDVSAALIARHLAEHEADREEYVSPNEETAVVPYRPRRFLALNAALRAHRTALVLHLFRRGWIEHGYVSHAAVDIDDPVRLVRTEPLRTLLATGGDEAFERLRSVLPLTVDRPLVPSTAHPLRVRMPALGGAMARFYRESYFSIVTETHFDAGEVVRFTEKTWKPVANLHPFVLVGPPGLLSEFRKGGFESFHPFIDETYDSVIDPVARFQAILTEIDRLCMMDMGTLDRWYRELSPILRRNRKRLLGTRERMLRRLHVALAQFTEIS
jgi:hypothetical protein